MKKLGFFLLLLACLLLVTSCAKLPTLEPTGNGDYKSSKGGALYVRAPLSYLAASHSKEAVARLVNKTGEHDLYAVGKDLLCDDAGELYLPSGTTLPSSLSEFSPKSVSVCRQDVLILEIASSADKELLESLANAEEATKIPVEFSSFRYLLLFFSEEFEVCYRLEYRVFEKPDDPSLAWEFPEETCGFLYDVEKDSYKIAPSALYNLVTGGGL